MDNIKTTVSDYILKDFLAGAKREDLTDTTPLITGGILDSLATLQLVHFLEEKYKIELQAYEVNVDHLNTVEDIAKLVQEKIS
jgi:acyl carrier protein